MHFYKDVLKVNEIKTVEEISYFLQDQLFNKFKKSGIVVGLSGGLDSSLTAALGVKILGRDKVLGIILPEKESNPIDKKYALLLTKQLGIETIEKNITKAIEGFGVYSEVEKIIKEIVPEFDSSYKFNITLPQNLLERDRYNIYTLHVENKNGERKVKRINAIQLRALISLINVKFRVRMTCLYMFAERHNYIVCGTTNKTEMKLGFFAKYGDGGVDIELISHLYKSQVYQLARYLNLPAELIKRSPTPGTWSLEVSDKEFFFCLPYDLIDLLLYAKHNNIPFEEINKVLNLEESEIKRAYRDFDIKEKITWHLRQMPPNL